MEWLEALPWDGLRGGTPSSDASSSEYLTE